jgi:hypothetical protein
MSDESMAEETWREKVWSWVIAIGVVLALTGYCSVSEQKARDGLRRESYARFAGLPGATREQVVAAVDKHHERVVQECIRRSRRSVDTVDREAYFRVMASRVTEELGRERPK